MAVPKKRRTKTRQGHSRSHLALKKQNLTKCTKCAEPTISHQVCPTCGTYKSDQVIDFSSKPNNKKKK